MLGHTERFCHAVGLQDGESHLYRHISESSLVPHLYRMLFASRAVAGMASEGPSVEFVALYVHMSAGPCIGVASAVKLRSVLTCCRIAAYAAIGVGWLQ